MGLLDWLTESLGGMGGGGSSNAPFMSATAGYKGPGDAPLQPAELQGAPMPPPPGRPPLPMAEDPMTAGGAVPNGPGLSMPPGIPMPQPRPPGADAAPPPTAAMPNTPNAPNAPPSAALPPNAAPTAGPPGLDLPGAMQSYGRAGGTMEAPQDPARQAQARTMLGRALGMDPNSESQLRGTLAAGFKAAGESAGKSPGQAFSSGVGAGMEGGKKADDATDDKQNKYLSRAIEARRLGNTEEYQKNLMRYQMEKLKLEQERVSGAGSKASVVNSQEQLYLRAIGATNQDAGIKASANTVRETQKQFGPDSKEAKAAMEAHEARIKQVRDGHLTQLGIDPGKIGDIANKPGFSEKTPFKEFPKDPAAAQKAFDKLPEGAYFINPKDGKLLIKRGAGSANAANPAQVPVAPGAPQAPAPPALATANAEDDD